MQTGLSLEDSKRFCCLPIQLGTFPLFAQYINTVAIMLNEPIYEIMVRVAYARSEALVSLYTLTRTLVCVLKEWHTYFSQFVKVLILESPVYKGLNLTVCSVYVS